ncbi:MAG: hypothetical protein L0Z70_00505 [Chloroflexi bacterium]|nr:hypothetical protein [Chloroflexota bacterium]
MDIHLLPIGRKDGVDQSELPGFWGMAAPRRAARGRSSDRLILYLAVEGGGAPPAAQQKQLLQRMAQLYYNSPGTVTSAMRAVAESLNQFLLERNLRSTGGAATGALAILAVRGEQIYLAQCGPMQAFLITAQGVQHWYDPQAARRSLGMGRVATIQYSQAQLSAHDTLLLSAQAPASWEAGLLDGLHEQGPEGIRRRLAGQAESLQAALVQARSGPGSLTWLQPRPQAAVPAPAEATPAAQQPALEAEILPLAAAEMPVEEAQPFVFVEAPPEEEAQTPAVEEIEPLASLAEAEVEPAQEATTPPSRAERARRRARPPRPNPLAPAMVAFGQAGSRAGGALRGLLLRMLPGESFFTIPAAAMAFIAIATPLIVVAVASVVYFRSGRAGEYQALYDQAVLAAHEAEAQQDANARRQAWAQTLDLLQQAQVYQETEDAQALFARARQALDELNLAVRLDYQPAIIGDLPRQAQISRMAAAGDDLFLLDAGSGSAWRALSTERGYLLDETFQCGPGMPGSQTIGKLLDILIFPTEGHSSATLLGMDGAGNLLECRAGESPVFVSPAAPDTGWKTPLAFHYDQGDLFVLDTGGNMVWVYRSSDFTRAPRRYFEQDIPRSLPQASDLAANGSDLYLLRGDGGVVQCLNSGVEGAATTCNDPAVFVDNRPGLEKQAYAPGAAFTQFQITQPPEPSLYFLSAETQALHRFSLSFTYHRAYLPVQAVEGDESWATAFAFDPQARRMFLALGSQVLYAATP